MRELSAIRNQNPNNFVGGRSDQGMLIPEPPERLAGLEKGDPRRLARGEEGEDMPISRPEFKLIPEFMGMIALREDRPDMEEAAESLDRAGVEKPPTASVEVID